MSYQTMINKTQNAIVSDSLTFWVGSCFVYSYFVLNLSRVLGLHYKTSNHNE